MLKHIKTQYSKMNTISSQINNLIQKINNVLVFDHNNLNDLFTITSINKNIKLYFKSPPQIISSFFYPFDPTITYDLIWCSDSYVPQSMLIHLEKDTIISFPKSITNLRLKPVIVTSERSYYMWNNEVTVVTGIYDLLSMDDKMNRVGEQFGCLLKLISNIGSNPLIIYTSSKLYPHIQRLVSNRKNTNIELLDFDNFWSTRYLQEISTSQKSLSIYDTIFNINKLEFLRDSIERNPFLSNRFIWINCNLANTAQNMEILPTILEKVPDKIKQMITNPKSNLLSSIISGSNKNLLAYADLFRIKIQSSMDNKIYQTEEELMTIIYEELIDMFSLYYGDNEDIIRNYMFPLSNNKGILWKHVISYLNEFNYEKLKKFFDWVHEIYGNTMIKLVDKFKIDLCYYSILSYYYIHNKTFPTEFIQFINENYQLLKPIIEDQKNNIEYYENKDLIRLE